VTIAGIEESAAGLARGIARREFDGVSARPFIGRETNCVNFGMLEAA
jgi:hypothetical protein